MEKKNITDILEGKENYQGEAHYKGYQYEPIKFIIDMKFDFIQGNILKYAIRFRDKGGKKDLLKALDYVRRELEKLLEVPEEKRVKKEIDRKAIGCIVAFTAQDRINDEDRDFIIDVAKYLHAGMINRVYEVIIDKLEKVYISRGDKESSMTSDYKTQLIQVKEAVDYVLTKVKKREDANKDGSVLKEMQANSENYRDMKLMLEVFRDNIKL